MDSISRRRCARPKSSPLIKQLPGLESGAMFNKELVQASQAHYANLKPLSPHIESPKKVGSTTAVKSSTVSSHQIGDDAVPGSALHKGLYSRWTYAVGAGGVRIVMSQVSASNTKAKGQDDRSMLTLSSVDPTHEAAIRGEQTFFNDRLGRRIEVVRRANEKRGNGELAEKNQQQECILQIFEID